ncbi:MAG: type II secretion system major pseudopilin GspG [Planctomycetota bacterium]
MSFKISPSFRIQSQFGKCKTGFSLMELMVVLMIIGLLGAAVAIGVRGAAATGRKTTVEMELNEISNGLDLYNFHTGTYPTQEQGLEILLEPTGEFEGGILKKKGALEDPWGNPYLYFVTNDKKEPFEVLCTGADGREGTSDDISTRAQDR